MNKLASNNKLLIEIFSDIVWPWCWVGKRKLETALLTYQKKNEKENVEAEVIWRPYQLRPNAPQEGIPKPPDTPNNPRVGARMKAAGEAVGINFTGKCDKSPNTLLAHCLLEYVLEKYGSTKQNEVQERIFKGYFTDGIFPDAKNLSEIGQACGIDKAEVGAALNNPENLEKVLRSVRRNGRQVRGGVPMFVINGHAAFSGAQDPAAFHQVFDRILLSDE